MVVIDYNEPLLARMQEAFGRPNVSVVANSGPQGLSGARNTGVAASESGLTLFLDDDALPDKGWIDAYRSRFSTSESIVGVGGAVVPAWEGGLAPRWFPDEFGWVVGCDYRGLPANGQQIRNPIGASMGIRHWCFDLVGGFSHAVGRIGAVPSGDEETELFIRVRRAVPGAQIVRDTGAVVFHTVPSARQTVKYFVSRCYHEGRSKAAMTETVGTADGLSSERSYVLKTLVGGMGIHFAAALNGDPAGLARAVMLPLGLAATTYGFAIARVQSRRRTR